MGAAGRAVSDDIRGIISVLTPSISHLPRLVVRHVVVTVRCVQRYISRVLLAKRLVMTFPGMISMLTPPFCIRPHWWSPLICRTSLPMCYVRCPRRNARHSSSSLRCAVHTRSFCRSSRDGFALVRPLNFPSYCLFSTWWA